MPPRPQHAPSYTRLVSCPFRSALSLPLHGHGDGGHVCQGLSQPAGEPVRLFVLLGAGYLQHLDSHRRLEEADSVDPQLLDVNFLLGRSKDRAIRQYPFSGLRLQREDYCRGPGSLQLQLQVTEGLAANAGVGAGWRTSLPLLHYGGPGLLPGNCRRARAC